MKELFQSDEYYSFLEGTGLVTPFSYKSPNARILGYIQSNGYFLKHFLTRRAIILGGPSFSKEITESEIEKLLIECIDGLKSKAIYVETRNFHDYSQYRSVFERCGFLYEPHYDFIVNTTDINNTENLLGKSRRRDIRTSLREGASIVEEPTEDQIRFFYSILHNLYKTRVKTPLFPLSFFIKLNQTSFSKFLLVQYHDEIIGGTVCVYDDETVYEWFACGKDGVYKNIHPSTLATWSGIRFSAITGHKTFDMMGAGAPGDGGYGVREYKAKFGGELVEYGRFKYVCNKPLYQVGRLGVSILKKLK